MIVLVTKRTGTGLRGQMMSSVLSLKGQWGIKVGIDSK